MKFEELLTAHRVPYQTEGRYCRDGWVQFQCPWCRGGTDPNKPYMGYNSYGGYVNCWSCGRHPLGDTIIRLTGLGWREVKDLLGRVDRRRVGEPKFTGKLVLPGGLGPLQPAHRRYLAGRGFTDIDKLEQMWGLQGIGIAARLRWRIFIPVHVAGRVVSWTTRVISDASHNERYRSAGEQEEAMPHRTLLYGADYARHAIIIVEGPLDVWRIGPGAVCTCGTGYSPAQVAAMARYAVRGVCFDNEPAAQRRARQLADTLSVYDGETFNITLDSKDPGSATPHELARLREEVLAA